MSPRPKVDLEMATVALVIALREKAALEKQLAATRAVLADVREGRMGCGLFSVEVEAAHDDGSDEWDNDQPDELLVRAVSVDDVLAVARDHCELRASHEPGDEPVSFTVRVFRVKDAGPGLLQLEPHTEHEIVVGEEGF